MKTLICGPMYSGKSTALFQRLERFLFAKKKVLLIRPKKDDRGYFTHSGGIDLDKLEKNNPNFVILTLKDIDESDVKSIATDGFDVVFVDEYFMIPGAHLLCHQDNYDVYFGGLLADSESELFPETIKILPYCDKIKKLNGVCIKCGSELGNYSFAAFDKKEKIVVGDTKYECLCHKCYKEAQHEKKITKEAE